MGKVVSKHYEEVFDLIDAAQELHIKKKGVVNWQDRSSRVGFFMTLSDVIAEHALITKRLNQRTERKQGPRQAFYAAQHLMKVYGKDNFVKAIKALGYVQTHRGAGFDFEESESVDFRDSCE